MSYENYLLRDGSQEKPVRNEANSVEQGMKLKEMCDISWSPGWFHGKLWSLNSLTVLNYLEIKRLSFCTLSLNYWMQAAPGKSIHSQALPSEAAPKGNCLKKVQLGDIHSECTQQVGWVYSPSQSDPGQASASARRGHPCTTRSIASPIKFIPSRQFLHETDWSRFWETIVKEADGTNCSWRGPKS